MRKTVVLAGRACELGLSPQQVQAVVLPVVEATLAACERGLEGAGLGWGQMEHVLLVGGSSLLPSVRAGAGCGQCQAGSRAGAAPAAPGRGLWRGRAGGCICHAGQHAGAGAPGRGALPPGPAGARCRQRPVARVQVLVERNSPLPARATTP